ncbi:Cyclin-B2-2 [Nymphaea thermarum]|nr:Cyclin-B2-2 [Nymphaea thermarum]
MARATNRRALGDLGNLIGGLSDRSSIPQNSKQFNPQQYGAILAKNQSIPQASRNCGKENVGNVECRSKQRRTLSPIKKKGQNQETQGQVDVTMEEMDCESSPTSSSMSEEPCEIEMEEADSPIASIDKDDVKNPLAVVDYIEDIYNHYRRTEIMSCVPEDYMSKQTDINHRMRAILVDWLIEVHHKFDLMHETLFLAINLIDRYLSIQNVVRKSLQLVGITGMLLACKYEEVYVPALEDFVIISDRAYTREDVLKMEKSMLNTLQFNVSNPTPFVFMRRFLKAVECDKKLEMVAFYLVELCLVDYRMLKFPPSLLASAAIYAGRRLLKLSPQWNKIVNIHSTYSEEQLQECAELMGEIHQNAGVGKLTSVYRKYSISKYDCVAKLMNPLLQ